MSLSSARCTQTLLLVSALLFTCATATNESTAEQAIDASVYYGSTYWNDIPQVADHIRAMATGDSSVDWMHHLKGYRKGVPFQKALFLSCGNGWVERDLFKLGIVTGGLGIDLMPEFVSQAQTAADEIGAPFKYTVHDSNKEEFPPGPFDLVLNHAAAHHIAFIDRAFSQLRDRLTPDGLFVSWDYVGPHRNQYPEDMWQMLHDVNRLLPSSLTQTLGYPHVPTMLHNDPSEAVHSELFVDTLKRYFDVPYWRSIGGAVAYPLITHNQRFFQNRTASQSDVSRAVNMLLLFDQMFTNSSGITLFAYAIAQPKKKVDHEVASKAKAVEEAREDMALHMGGIYYPQTLTSIREYGDFHWRSPPVSPSPPFVPRPFKPFSVPDHVPYSSGGLFLLGILFGVLFVALVVQCRNVRPRARRQ